jgi:hypothetical protein
MFIFYARFASANKHIIYFLTSFPVVSVVAYLGTAAGNIYSMSVNVIVDLYFSESENIESFIFGGGILSQKRGFVFDFTYGIVSTFLGGGLFLLAMFNLGATLGAVRTGAAITYSYYY